MSFLYETHLHTAGVSKCAVSKGYEYIAPYIDNGYSGIVVTDHFFHGNCAIPQNLPWSEWVDKFCRGYENAREEGERRGFDVFFGWEETFSEGDDYLIYGLDKAWLLQHPECRYWTRAQQYNAVKEAGGCVVQAHPFRQRHYITSIVLSTHFVDGVEVANGGHENDAAFDALAFHYALKIGKPVFAGSDIHDAAQITCGDVYGIYLNEKIDSVMGIVNAVCGNNIAGIKADNARFELHGNEDVILPVDVRDKIDRSTGRHWKEFI